MKKILIQILSVIFVLASCNEQNPVDRPVKTGSFSLSVKCDTDDYTDKHPDVKSATGVSVVDTDLFTVMIEKKYDEYNQEASWSNVWTLNEFPPLLELSPGRYRISVNSPVVDRVSTTAPIYAAQKDFSIVEDKVTDLEIVCTIQNMKVSVVPTENFFTELRNFTISVTAEYDGIDTPVSVSWKDADFTKGADGKYTSTKVAFFEAVPLSVMVTGIRTLDGSDATLKEPVVISDVSPRDHHILNVDVQVTGDVKSTIITVDPSLNDPTEKNVWVDGFEEIPIPDEEEKEEDNTGTASKETTITWASNPEMNPVNLIVEGENVTVDPQVQLVVNCPRKIASFVIQVSDNFKSVIGLLTTDKVEYLDLINDQKLIDFFVDEMYLPTGSALKDKTQVEFDLSHLAKMVPTIAAYDQDETTFTLQIEDSTGKTFVKDIKFLTVAPSNPRPSEE